MRRKPVPGQTMSGGSTGVRRYALMLFSRTTWPQMLTCLAKNVENSLPSASSSVICCVSCSCAATAGSLRISFTDFAMLAMTSGGVSFGAKTPHQASVSKSGKPASMAVCVSLSTGMRSRPICRMGRSMLVPSCAVTSAADPMIMSTWLVHRRAAAAVGHMHDLHAGLLAEHRHRQMAERADADGGVFHRAGTCLAGGDHVGNGLVRPLGVRGEDVRRGAD